MIRKLEFILSELNSKKWLKLNGSILKISKYHLILVEAKIINIYLKLNIFNVRDI